MDFGSGIAVSNLEIKNTCEIGAILDIGLSAELGPRAVSVTNAQPGGGSANLTNIFVVKSDVVSLVDNNHEQSSPRFALYEPFPNPFNSRTAISYQLLAPSGVEGSAVSFVTLKVFDLLGREIASLVSGGQDAGVHQVWFDAGNVTSGVYVVRLVSESLDSHARFVASRKIVLLK
jgi:hypothetical protein